jgi:SET domain-containing protein
MKRPTAIPTILPHVLFELDDGPRDRRARARQCRALDQPLVRAQLHHVRGRQRPCSSRPSDDQAGEELSYDYRLIVDGRMSKKERASYECRCGKRQCRGTMLNPKR